MWDQVDVYLNNQLISKSTKCYPYKTMLEELMTKGRETKETQLRTQGYYKVIAGNMDAANVLSHGNSDLTKRYALVSMSQKASTYGALRADACQ
jgi:hypothetical protein